MKILLISQFFSTTKGGGEYVFKTIAKVMTEKGHKVWVITNNVEGENFQDSPNLKIIKIGNPIEYKGGLPPTFLENIKFVFNAFQRGRKIINEQKIDLIHSNNFSPALAGSLLSSFTKVPHITTIHDIFSLYDKSFWKKWAKQTNVSYTSAILIPIFEKLMMKFRYNCIHTVSNATRNDIQRINQNKPIYLISNCLLEEQPISTNLKQEQFVYLGRLVFYKNLEVILNAFELVTKQYPKANLVIAGAGPHKKSLQEMVEKLGISDNISFVGYVTPKQKSKLLAESNALLFPSKIEGFGLVILEAFDQSRPVLVSDIPPMSEIVEDKKTGLVIDSDDPKSWADAVIFLIENSQKSNFMGKNGNQTLKEKYNQKLFYENLIDMYDNVVLGKISKKRY